MSHVSELDLSAFPPQVRNSARLAGHNVQFYQDDNFLVEIVSRFIGSALGAGDAAVVIATRRHREELNDCLRRRGLDLAPLMMKGQLVLMDAVETLGRFTVEGWPDQDRFQQAIGSVIEHARAAATDPRRPVAAFGEMVAIFWAEGRPEAAVRLEQLWNDLARTHDFNLLCAYPMSLFADEQTGPLIEKICAEHSHLFPAESYTSLATEEDRRAGIIALQQKAEAFETLARERETLAEALAREIEDLRQLHELSTAISQLDLKQVLHDLLEVATTLHKTDMGLLSLADTEDQGLVTAASLGFSNEFLKVIERVPSGSGACGTALLVRNRIIVEDTETDPAFSSFREAARRAGFRAVHSTPLVGKSGEIIGVISVHFRRPYRPSQREIRFMDVYARLAVNAIENARLYEAAQQEISYRKQAQAALIQSEKLASVGRLAATIAHEINNPLEAVNNLLFLAQRDITEPVKAAQRLDLAVEELDRVAHITRQTLGFCRDNSSPVTVDLSTMLDELMSIYGRKLETRGITVVKEFDRKASINGLAGEIRQVFSNLISNAIDAMPLGGRLRVKVSSSREWNNSGLPGARVTFSDTGAGIPPEQKKHLFQAFYTTKKDVGTGLGLWIARGIVEKHHGMIHVRSMTEPGRSGSTFSVFLPEESQVVTDPSAVTAQN